MILDNRKKQLEKLMNIINLQLEKYDLLNAALTHPSYVFEKGEKAGAHNQRLEFLGDAVVGLIIADYLFKRFPHKSEGELTKMRAAVVCENSLARAASKLNLGSYLLMGKGEKLGGGAFRASNLADAWEALIGALYLELGLDNIRNFTLSYLQGEIEKVVSGDYGDYKTQFQEFIQKQQDVIIEYRILSEKGPDHAKEFNAGIYVNNKLIAQGMGKTKKEAEQNAAHQALIRMDVL